jgi:hypothetical protein
MNHPSTDYLDCYDPDQLIITAIDGVTMLVPRSYLGHSEKYNGCGPDGLGALVPNSVLGLELTEACDVHDHMCIRCANLVEEIITDGVFAFNIIARVVSKSNKFMVWPRLLLVMKYIIAVSATVFTRNRWRKNKLECPDGRYFDNSKGVIDTD